MRVEEIVPFAEYYRDKRFAMKIPDYTKAKVIHKCGDNIYKPLPDGSFRQLQSMHSFGPNENPKTKAHDLGGWNVLISKTFYYFGSQPLDLPESLKELVVGRAHKSNFSQATISAFRDFISKQTAGVTAAPTDWPPHDDSWTTFQG